MSHDQNSIIQRLARMEEKMDNVAQCIGATPQPLPENTTGGINPHVAEITTYYQIGQDEASTRPVVEALDAFPRDSDPEAFVIVVHLINPNAPSNASKLFSRRCHCYIVRDVESMNAAQALVMSDISSVGDLKDFRITSFTVYNTALNLDTDEPNGALDHSEQ